VAQVVEHLPGKLKTQSSNLSNGKKKSNMPYVLHREETLNQKHI
jgi:hypothetical protein